MYSIHISRVPYGPCAAGGIHCVNSLLIRIWHSHSIISEVEEGNRKKMQEAHQICISLLYGRLKNGQRPRIISWVVLPYRPCWPSWQVYSC